MSRAIRRQQAGATETAARRPFGSKAPRPSRGQRPTAAPKKRFRLSAPRWVEEIVSELKKVTWPTREETAYLTMVVIVVSIVVGTVLGVIDIFFNELIDRVLLR
jgi:preprotein translocase subunit SecE